MRTLKRSDPQNLTDASAALGPFTVVAAGGSENNGNVVVHVGELNLAIQWFDAEKFEDPKPVNIYKAKDWAPHKLGVQEKDYVYVKISKAGGTLKLVSRPEEWKEIPPAEKKPHDIIWVPIGFIEKIEKADEDVVISIKQLFKSDGHQKKEYWNAFEPVLWQQGANAKEKESGGEPSEGGGGGWKCVFTPGALHMSHEQVEPFDPLITFAESEDEEGAFMKDYPICSVAEGDKFYLNFEVDGPNDSVLIGVPRFEKSEQSIVDAREKRPSLDPPPEKVEDPDGIVGYYSVFIGEIKKDVDQLYYEPCWRSDYIYHRDRRFGDLLSSGPSSGPSSGYQPPSDPSYPNYPPEITPIPPGWIPINPFPWVEYYVVCTPGTPYTSAPSNSPTSPETPGTPSGGSAPSSPLTPPDCVTIQFPDCPPTTIQWDPDREMYFGGLGGETNMNDGWTEMVWEEGEWKVYKIKQVDTGEAIIVMEEVWEGNSDPEHPFGLAIPDADNPSTEDAQILSWDSPFGDDLANYDDPNGGPLGTDNYVWAEGDEFSTVPDGPEPQTQFVGPTGLDPDQDQSVVSADTGGLEWRSTAAYGQSAPGNNIDYTSQQIINAIS